MVNWISEQVGNFAEWIGTGFSRFLDWLLGGIYIIVEAIIEGADSVFELFDSIWQLITSVIENIEVLLETWFPFIPAPVMLAINSALLVSCIVGIVKKVSGK